MSTDRDTMRIVRSWLRTDEHESADRVLDAVLDRLDTTPQRGATWSPAWRFTTMNNVLRWGTAAVVVAALAILGFSFLSGGPGAGTGPATPSPTATAVEPTPSPTPVVDGELPTVGAIGRGSYIVDDPFRIPFRLEIGPGWQLWGGDFAADVGALYEGSLDPPAGHGIIFVTVANTYADPCDPSAGAMRPEIGPTVEDLAAAIAAQPGTESSEPVPVVIDGYAGVYLDYRNTGAACRTLYRWPSSGGDRKALTNERDQAWIIDVAGERLVIDAFSFGGTLQADLDEMRQMIESLDFDPVR